MLRTRIIAGPAALVVVSVVFAAFLTLLTRAETFVDPLRVVPGQPAPVTLRLPRVRLPSSPPGATGRALVVARGEVVRDPAVAGLVRSVERSRRPPRTVDLLGAGLIGFLLLLSLLSYLRSVSPGRGALLRVQLGLLALTWALLAACKAILLLTPLPAMVLPLAAIPMWTAMVLDRRSGFALAVAVALFGGALVRFDPVALAVSVAAGLAAVLVVEDQRRTTRLLLAGVVAAVAGAAMYLAVRLVLDGAVDPVGELGRPWSSGLLASAAGGLGAGVLAFVLRPVAVLALGAVSRARLLELSDLDQPLLRRMAEEAPGSWEHSRAMANLAEAAANAIGADALLTRVGAYYHDLGKTCQARYFVENLGPGEASPHRQLPPDLSADAIMAHVVEGVNILRRGGVPEPVVEFSYTHHGTSVIEYFWHKTLEGGNPRGRKEAFFRYPGMRPRTRETALLMLVDAIEAASRTVDPPERPQFEDLVQRIVYMKLRQGQLDESGLTLAELRTLSSRIVDSLCSMFHSRIRYPWQDKEEGGEDLPLPGVATEEDVARAREADIADADTDEGPAVDTAEDWEDDTIAGEPPRVEPPHGPRDVPPPEET